MNGIFKQTGLRGGVHTLDGVEDVVHFADKMCGKWMSSTHLTHMPEGLLCRSVLVQEYLNSEKEFFLKSHYFMKRCNNNLEVGVYTLCQENFVQ